MIKLIIGFVLGFCVATVGADGVGKMVNKGVTQGQVIVKDAAK